MKLTAELTNVDADKVITYTNSYFGTNEAMIHTDGNVSHGAWYNYAAATAMTITGSSNTAEATQSLCPAGWRLPTHAEQVSIGSYRDAFSPVTGGNYSNGGYHDSDFGLWWASTVYNAARRYAMSWNTRGYPALNLYTDQYSSRELGQYVRCVRTS